MVWVCACVCVFRLCVVAWLDTGLNWRGSKKGREVVLIDFDGISTHLPYTGLNSGAKVYMADFEDSTSPTWANLIQGQVNLRDAVRGTISFTAPDGKKTYRLKDSTAVLFVRPRGLHLDEAHVTVNGQPIAAGIFDLAVYLVGKRAEVSAGAAYSLSI